MLDVTKKTALAASVAAFFASAASAEQSAVRGPFAFEPLMASAAVGSKEACSPISLPEGFSQTVLVSETGACPGVALDVVAGENDLTDMSTVNETGAQVGRFLYRTHENGTGKAALSAIDLKTGKTAVYTGQDFGFEGGWARFDGLEWTPWGTLLAAEENGEFGRLFECEVDGLKVLNCYDRPAVGRMSHEGIAVDGNGNIYVGDELNGGSIYKFVPARYGDLSEGTLYALNIVEPGAIGGTGKGEWIALIPGQNNVVTDPAISARQAANQAGATDYLRPEDAEIIGPNLYFATTTDSRVLQIPLTTDTPVVTEFAGVNIGNVAGESVNPTHGLRSPDNLASDSAGNLYIVEDNSPSDVWVATPDQNGDGVSDSVVLFATLTTPGAEGTGIYFARTMPKTLLINVQHAADGNDMTIAISKD